MIIETDEFSNLCVRERERERGEERKGVVVLVSWNIAEVLTSSW